MAAEDLEKFGYHLVDDSPPARTWSADPPGCPRCPSKLSWIHGSWQCTNCKYKEGCCEGEPQS